MVTAGTQIEATQYNEIQSLVNQVLGVNTGGDSYGYGQTVTSSQVLRNTRITVAQWNSLRNDILAVRQHQTGTDLSSSLTIPATTVKIDAADREAYNSLIQEAALEVNRLAVPPLSQATRENLVANQSNSPNWNNSLVQTVTVTFPGYTVTNGGNSVTVTGADHARCYFNTGSYFEIKSALAGGQTATVGTKDNSWYNLLNGMGTIYFNRSATTCTGSGTTSSIGWADLTSTDQVIFTRTLSDAYTPNRYRILARAPSLSQIVFTIYWEDLSTASSGGTDENVTGTVTSYIQAYRASGNNVSIPLPQATTTSLGGGAPVQPATYNITPSTTSVNEGGSVTWTINTTNFGSGTLYYTNTGTATVSDFGDVQNSGSITITNDVGTLTKTLINDVSTEGSETVIIQLRTGSTSGTIVKTSSTVTVTDTSVSVPTYSISPSASSVNEGGSITWTITTTNFGSGTLYYTNGGNTAAADFSDSLNSGSITITNNSGTLTKTLRSDVSTEGSETIIIQLRTGSTGGSVVATSSGVIVGDTSLSIETVTVVTVLRASYGPDTAGGNHAIEFVWQTSTGRSGRVNSDLHVSAVIAQYGYDGSYARSCVGQPYTAVQAYLNAGTPLG